jgi:ABC-type polysaccharide/polyol phosphate export permease
VTEQVYDSAAPRRPLADLLANLGGYRELVRVLFRRQVSAQYDRTFLGPWWGLIVPLTYALTLYVIFAQVFDSKVGSTPYVVYVLSGVVVAAFVSRALLGVGGAIVENAVLLRKVFVPPEVFAAAAAGAATIPLAVTLAALAVAQIVTGVGIPWTFALLPLAAAALVLAVGGLGLAVAALAVRFRDTTEVVRIAITLMTFATPIFYPVSIVPDRVRTLLEFNPVYQFLAVFRALAYEAAMPPAWALVGVAVSTVGSVALGVWAFSRARLWIATML